MSEQYKDGGFGLGEMIQQRTVYPPHLHIVSLVIDTLVGHFKGGLPFMQWMVCFVSISR